MEISISCRELPATIRALRRADPELAKLLKRNIREAEQPAKRAMEASAAAAGMNKAAHAVQPSNRYSGSSAELGLKVNARIAPNARPLDKPNRGDFNRHPVFGNWKNKVDQPARRFSDRGFDAGTKDVQEKLDAVLGDWARFLSA